MVETTLNKPRRIYTLVVVIWLILIAVVMYGIVAFDLQRAEKRFGSNANLHFQQVNDRVHVNESVLEGFAAMMSAANELDRTRIRIYAQQMLRQYPHIFMFEIIEKVPRGKLEQFVEHYRQTVYPDFEIKSFDYEKGRQWQPVKDTPFHLPIVFMEPFPPESRKVLGLDISSNSFFMQSLQESERLKRSVSTVPFRLVEGNLAYLIHRPIPVAGISGRTQDGHGLTAGGFVVLVIRADTLLDRDNPTLAGMRTVLYNPAYSSTDPEGLLQAHGSLDAGRLETLLFPCLSTGRQLDSKSQPFILLVEQQLGWHIISWGKLALALLIGIISFAVMVVYARLYFHEEMERAEMTVRLFYLANHDVLTGLANRNLLFDRLGHAISQAARQQKQLAVLFLDLDDFKKINDSCGHEAGDSVLKSVAERLRACVRAGDTIARLGGDEFILVLENISSQEDVTHIIRKIKAGFERRFSVNGRPMQLGISIGSAIYPQDGTDVETLINHADTSMYEDKRSGA